MEPGQYVQLKSCRVVSITLLLYTVKNGSLLQHNNVSLLGYVSKIVSILLSKCPNADTSLCYCNITVYNNF